MSTFTAHGPYYLNGEGMPVPSPQNDDLDLPYWEATKNHRLAVQRCLSCQTYQWGPEWICHNCLSFDIGWQDIDPVGTIYSWERPWHPVTQALVGATPYLIVLVELPYAGRVRMVGNLLGDPTQQVVIGTQVHAVFEDHDGYSLVHWQC